MGIMGKATVGERIRECRIDLGLSQEALAEIMYMKKATISKYENDRNDIPSSVIVSLSETLETSPNYLLLGSDTDDPEDTWIEDMLQVMKKITEPIYRDLALKQLKCIAGIAA